MMELILNKELTASRTLNRTIVSAFFIICMMLGAFVRIPLSFTPVPLTLQTFFVLLSAAFLGSRLGTFTQAGYILSGSLGLQVFAGAGLGLAYLLGPTGGYLLGFVLAAFCIGKLINKVSNNWLAVFGLFCLASALILFCGTLWLKVITGFSFKSVILMGYLPFVPGDVIKSFFAAVIFMQLKNRSKAIL